MSKITLITGGSRSGKSRHALALTETYSSKLFLATAEPLDDEMRSRIVRHKLERGSEFGTVEEPVEIAGVIQSEGETVGLILLDCLTVWLGNLSYHLKNESEIQNRIDAFLETLKSPPCDLIIVTNELGMGIIPENPETRKFRDAAGRLNQQVAHLADTVILVVSGIPMVIKGTT